MKMHRLHLLLFLVLTGSMCMGQSSPPYQFIAKVYKEVYGRSVDPSGWAYWHSQMANATSQTAVMNLMIVMLQSSLVSSEFRSDYPITFTDSPALKYEEFRPRVLALYRATLNREPSSSEMNSLLGALQYSTDESPWDLTVNWLASSGNPEFVGLSNSIYNETFYGWQNYQGNEESNTYRQVISGATLQNTLNTAASGSTVCLQPMTLVLLDATLIIPLFFPPEIRPHFRLKIAHLSDPV